jgi:hypothetical protein
LNFALLADRVNDIILRPRLVVLSNLAEFSLRLEVYDVVTGRLQLTEQFRHCRSGVAVEIMQQDDPLAALFQLAHYRINLLLGLVHGEIARVDMGRKDRDIPIGEIRKKLRRSLEVRETEKRRHFSTGCGDVHYAVHHLDFLLGLFEIFGVGVSR